MWNNVGDKINLAIEYFISTIKIKDLTAKMITKEAPNILNDIFVQLYNTEKIGYTSEESVLIHNSVLQYFRNPYSFDKELTPLRTEQVIYPKSICHYTTISTLLKILHSGNFRFNRIDNVNDAQEVKSLQYGYLNNCDRIFISCFSEPKTKKSAESIPMWEIYGKRELGAMLKIHYKRGTNAAHLFYGEEIRGEKLSQGGQQSSTMYPLVMSDNDWLFRGKKMCVELDAVRIDYVNDLRYAPETYVKSENKYYSLPANFAREKSEYWKYENELRFRAIFRYNSNTTGFDVEHDIKSLYATINPEAIERIEIVFNPWSNKSEVEDWKEIIRHVLADKLKTVRIDFSLSLLTGGIR